MAYLCAIIQTERIELLLTANDRGCVPALRKDCQVIETNLSIKDEDHHDQHHRYDEKRTNKRRKRSWKKRILFGCLTFVLCLMLLAIACELLLRILAPQLLIPRYVTASGFGIRVHCPNISIQHTTPDYRISICTNSMGIRTDREFTYDKPEGVFRIVVLGDSFTFGYGVEVEQTYGVVLERIIKEQGTSVEMINLGVSGAGTAEELIMLKNCGLRFDPDLVVVGYCCNDIVNDMLSKLYALNDQNQLVRDQESYLPAVKIRDFLYSFRIYRFLAERSHLLYFLRSNLSEAIQKSMTEKNRENKSLSHESEMCLTAALLDEIKRTSEENDATFCLLDIPSNKNKSNLPREYLVCVEEEDIIDLRPVFEQHMVTQKLYWTKSDGHWTPAGHKIAAELLADWVKTHLNISEHSQ